MKRFPCVAAQPWTLLDGTQPEGAPRLFTHFDFLLTRIQNAAFAEGIEGIAALLLAVACRDSLVKQRDHAEAEGWWVVEDQHAEALLRATTRPTGGYNLQAAALLLPMAQAVRELEPAE